ncbi:hypothetical protein [Streptosporangium sp. NPDC020145]|uniref:hypothetical protein n=1 Tax=Streptosporangium sp. NPDC020145 TaxID=3154694 RepID=UPI00341F7524
MNKLCFLASLALTVPLLSGTGSAAAAGAELRLYTDRSQAGDSVPVPVPTEERCVLVPNVFGSLSARNTSARFIAGLYLSEDCEGDAIEIVYPTHSLDFLRRHRIASIKFVPD